MNRLNPTLFDEIEKAHPEVWNALLQILDDGRLTDGQGRMVDFRNTVLIMTSNLGTQYVTHAGSLGFKSRGEGAEKADSDDKIEQALKDTFRPEFLNRIDEIIIFATLTMEQMEQIVDLQMDKVSDRLAEHGIHVELSSAARSWLAEEGYDPAFGARPLQRALQKYIESPLSIKILQGEFQENDTVIVDFLPDEGVIFRPPEDSTPVEIEEEVSA